MIEARESLINRPTCSIDNPKSGGVTFATNIEYLKKAFEYDKPLFVHIPSSVKWFLNANDLKCPENISLVTSEDPLLSFILYHNRVNAKKAPAANVVHPTANLGNTSIGNDGMRYVLNPNNIKYVNKRPGHYISMKHMGNVVIKERVVINVFSAIARATLDSTIVCEDVKIGTHVSLGHNVFIDKATTIVDGTIIGGSARVGKQCFIGLNSTVKNGIKIADNTLIGQGANVVKDIEFPGGIYVGSPAIRIKEWNGAMP